MKSEEETILSGAGFIKNHSLLQSEESSGGKAEPKPAHYTEISWELMYADAQTSRTSPS